MRMNEKNRKEQEQREKSQFLKEKRRVSSNSPSSLSFQCHNLFRFVVCRSIRTELRAHGLSGRGNHQVRIT
jgi:hypothetical protein